MRTRTLPTSAAGTLATFFGLSAFFALFASSAIGCSSSDTGPAVDASLVDGATDASLDTSPGKDTGGDTTPAPSACDLAGGHCGCAGGCPSGSHHGSVAEDEGCPQPCPGCGSCSEWCCLPDPSGDAGDGG